MSNFFMYIINHLSNQTVKKSEDKNISNKQWKYIPFSGYRHIQMQVTHVRQPVFDHGGLRERQPERRLNSAQTSQTFPERT